MITIILQTFKDRRISLIIYCLATIGLVWMFVSIYPIIQSQTASLEQLLKMYPEALMKAFNVDLTTYTTAGGYVSSEMFSFICPIMLITLITGYAGAAISGEVEKGTIGLLLSLPVSRIKIFLGKYFTGLLTLVIFTLVSIYSIPLFFSAYNVNYEIRDYHFLFVMYLIFGWAIYSIAMFFSSIFSDKGKVFSFTGGLMVLMFVFNIISGLKENLVNLKYTSFFYYFNATKILTQNYIDHWSYWMFSIVIVVFTTLSVLIFSKKDISV